MRIVYILLVFFISLSSCKSVVKDSNKTEVFYSGVEQKKKSIFPFPLGYVNDYEGIFSSIERENLEKIITKYELETTNEIAVVTVDKITPYTNINDFATDLSNDWGVGKKDKNNGLTIVVSKRLRKIRISTGLSTQKNITDNECKILIDSVIIPRFREGLYYQGIKNGLDELIEIWKTK